MSGKLAAKVPSCLFKFSFNEMIRYHANRLTGTTMEVTYEGEAHHPDLTLPLISSPPPTPIPRLARSNE